MNMKTSKKMRGFMCHSNPATAVCNVTDPRSVIVPRRLHLLHHHNSANNPLIDHSATSSKLVRSHSFSSSNTRPVFVSSIKNRQESSTRDFHDHPKPKPILKPPPPPPSLPSSDQIFQVVVMRVALHCQGCAGKVKKHLTKMEGVTSFSIDLESKMVTVMGHVSPAGVLESISKVKRAEFWPCSSSSTVERSSSAHQLLIK